MTLCDNCMKPITGQFTYSKEKNDGKKFCCSKCVYEYYGRKCDECGKVQNTLLEKNGKHFCSTACMNKHSNKKTKEQASDFWQKYKGWIIGGGIALLVLIILGVVFGGKKKWRR